MAAPVSGQGMITTMLELVQPGARSHFQGEYRNGMKQGRLTHTELNTQFAVCICVH